MAHAVDAAPPRPAIRRLEWSLAVPVLVLIGGAVLFWFMYHFYRHDTPVHSDGEGYYAYLPAWIGHFDPSLRTVVLGHMLPSFPKLAPHTAHDFGLSLQPTGNWLDKYGVGTAMLLVPFFVAGHVIALTGGYNANGYSTPELFVTGLGALGYTALGLLALRQVLRRHFGDAAVALTLVAVVLGTGLVSYFTFDPTFSHAFSFFAVALLLLTAERWYERPSSRWRAAALGCAMGLVVDIRLTNVVLLVAVPLLGTAVPSVGQRVALAARHRLSIVVMAAAALITFLPQVATWYVATGHLLVRTYSGEEFDFAHPHLLESLLWLKPHGFLPYAPVMAFAFIGLIWTWFRRRDIALPVTFAFLGFWYISSAWYDWSFSSAFGDRAFLDVLPLLALPMAAVFAALRRWYVRAAVGALAALCVLATCMLMVAWWQVRMSGNGVTASQYAQVLLHPSQLLGPPRVR